MNEWGTMVLITLELIIASILLSFILYLQNLGEQAGQREQERIDASIQLQEYREINKYATGTLIHYQDVVEYLLTYQGEKTGTVDKLASGAPNVEYYTRTDTRYDTSKYTLKRFLQDFYEDNASGYRTEVLTDANGVWTGVVFRAEP